MVAAVSDRFQVQAHRQLPPVALAGIDLNSGFMPVRRAFFFTGQPDVPRLLASLSVALAQWPDFAGTIALHDGVLSLLRNDTGVRVTVTAHDAVVPAFGINHPLGLPNPYCDEAIVQAAGDGAPVFTVKLSCYRDDHWVLGTCNSHALCDGSGYWQLMDSWRAAYHGETLPIISGDFPRYVPPAACRNGPGVPAQLQVPPLPLLPQQMANLALYRSAQCLLSQSRLDRLKSAINAALAPDWVSTTDALMAVLWQVLARVALAQGVSPAQAFPLANVINARQRLQLQQYVGNMAWSAVSGMTVEELVTSPVAALALRLRRDSQHLDTAAIHEYLAFLHDQLEQGQYNAGGYFTGFCSSIAAACIHGRGVMINNWSKFPAYAMDFSGPPLWFDLATVIPMHFAMLMPAVDGIVLRLFLPEPWLAEVMALLERDDLAVVGCHPSPHAIL